MKKNIISFTALAFFYFALTGCVNNNPYTAYYTNLSGTNTPETIAKIRATPPPEIPLVDHAPTKDGQARLDTWARKNYVAIGRSSFNSSGFIPEKLAVEQGKAVKADLIVLMDPEYSGSYVTSKAVIKPTSSTTVESATITDSKGRKSSTIQGTGTTYSTTTDYVPTTEHRANYTAFYYIKITPTFGVSTADLTEEERKKRQSNFGVKVIMVVDDSPAYNADILSGDILESFDGQKIKNKQNLVTMLGEKSGKKVEVVLSRDEKTIKKSIQFNK